MDLWRMYQELYRAGCEFCELKGRWLPLGEGRICPPGEPAAICTPSLTAQAIDDLASGDLVGNAEAVKWRRRKRKNGLSGRYVESMNVTERKAHDAAMVAVRDGIARRAGGGASGGRNAEGRHATGGTRRAGVVMRPYVKPRQLTDVPPEKIKRYPMGHSNLELGEAQKWDRLQSALGPRLTATERRAMSLHERQKFAEERQALGRDGDGKRMLLLRQSLRKIAKKELSRMEWNSRMRDLYHGKPARRRADQTLISRLREESLIEDQGVDPNEVGIDVDRE